MTRLGSSIETINFADAEEMRYFTSDASLIRITLQHKIT